MNDIPNKVLTCAEMRENAVVTNDYHFMKKTGFFRGWLTLKAEGKPGILRLFFQLEDGSKIITPVFYWQAYLGFWEAEINRYYDLEYAEGSQGKTYLKSAELVEEEVAEAEEDEEIDEDDDPLDSLLRLVKKQNL
jgi:hypothetical protein